MDVVQQTIQTYDRIAPDYCKKTRQSKFLEREESYIKKLLAVISKLNPLILDVGCGDGRHTILIEENGGGAIGIDLSSRESTGSKHPKRRGCTAIPNTKWPRSGFELT